MTHCNEDLAPVPLVQGGPYIGNTGHSGAFEVSVIELLDCGLQVVRSFEFNKT